MIIIRIMDASQVEHIAEVDRSEHITLNYQMQSGRLESFSVDWEVPRWSAEGDGGHALPVRVEKLREQIRAGAVMLGAFDHDVLAGFALLRYNLRPDLAELAALFVSRAYRRLGIAGQLCAEVERLARQAGARGLYVSATPSESAVGFYLSQGFIPVAEPLPDMLALEPEDIHMHKNFI